MSLHSLILTRTSFAPTERPLVETLMMKTTVATLKRREGDGTKDGDDTDENGDDEDRTKMIWIRLLLLPTTRTRKTRKTARTTMV